MTIPTITDDLIAEIEAEFQNAYDKGLTAYVDPDDGLTLIRHIRHLECWKASQIKVMGPVLDYAQGLQIAALGTSVTKALIDDHKRLRELEEVRRWVPVEERMPDEDSYVVAAKMYGHGIDPDMAVCLFSSGQFYVSADALEASNYDGGACITLDIKPTHWTPTPKPPCE